jgi:hypothetical protein
MFLRVFSAFIELKNREIRAEPPINYANPAPSASFACQDWLAPLHYGPQISGIGAWLSLVEHLLGVQEVAGSNPVAPTTFSYLVNIDCNFDRGIRWVILLLTVPIGDVVH